jgi:hypothetical protein
MQLNRHPPVHLTYCLNIASGESFADQVRAVAGWQPPRLPAGLGLRLGAQAAAEADQGDAATAFALWCAEHGRYVFTLNGFPYGPFHGTPVKASVYRPDWTRPERLAYTHYLAALLARWLPAGQTGSISTVPLWYAPDYADAGLVEQATTQAIRNLISCATQLEALADTTGADLVLALEPEPWCALETTGQTLRFFDRLLSSVAGPERDRVQRRIGVCLDTCHAALAFEDPLDGLNAYIAAGVRVAKIQLSAALVAYHPGDDAVRRRLAPFDEPVYFHQTAARDGERVLRWPDLGAALTDPAAAACGPWRIHYHVPLDWAGDDHLGSTRDTMSPAFWYALAAGACPHLEVETYTYDVLPPDLTAPSREAMMNRELAWVLHRLERHAH